MKKKEKRRKNMSMINFDDKDKLIKNKFRLNKFLIKLMRI